MMGGGDQMVDGGESGGGSVIRRSCRSRWRWRCFQVVMEVEEEVEV